ncbi:hypothetical protein AB0L57_29735 [Nocardia sp. NPDC052254]|uniref:hypothetical protein n=1 Tax=Nocardia sp. NPDC052254 TaxID=3155681 RepID=UPI003429E911
MRLSMEYASGIEPHRKGSVWRIHDSRRTGRHAPENHRPAMAPAYAEPNVAPGGFDEYKKSRKQGNRAFALWADPDRRRMIARVRTVAATRRGPATYEITGAAGELIGTATREPALRGGRIRTRWTVTAAGREPVIGHKGQSGWWVVWWFFFPLQAALAAFMVAALLLGGGDGDLARMPRRIRWRDNTTGAVTLDFHDDDLEAPDGHWDPRLVGGLVTLLRTFPGWLENAWDTQDHRGN